MSRYAEKALELESQFAASGGLTPLHKLAGTMPGRGLLPRHFQQVHDVIDRVHHAGHFQLSHMKHHQNRGPFNTHVLIGQTNSMRPVPDQGADAFAPTINLTIAAQHALLHLGRRLPLVFSNVDYIQMRHLADLNTPFNYAAGDFDRVMSFGMNLAKVLPQKWGNAAPPYEPVAIPHLGGMFVGTAHPVEADEFNLVTGSFVAKNVAVHNGRGVVMKYQRDNDPAVVERPGAVIVVRNFLGIGSMKEIERGVYDALQPYYTDPAYEGAELLRFHDYVYNNHVPQSRLGVPSYLRRSENKLLVDQESYALLAEYDAYQAKTEAALLATVTSPVWQEYTRDARQFIERHPVQYRGRFAPRGYSDQKSAPSSAVSTISAGVS